MTFFAVACGLVLLFLAVFFCWHEWQHFKVIERYHEERRQLLDRLMARDFAQYKQAEALADLREIYKQQVSSEKEEHSWTEVGV